MACSSQLSHTRRTLLCGAHAKCAYLYFANKTIPFWQWKVHIFLFTITHYLPTNTSNENAAVDINVQKHNAMHLRFLFSYSALVVNCHGIAYAFYFLASRRNASCVLLTCPECDGLSTLYYLLTLGLQYWYQYYYSIRRSIESNVD